MKKYTDVTMLVDRSGSMLLIKESMEEAIRSFIKEHQSVPSTRFSLIQFDSHNDHDIWISNSPIKEVKQSFILHPRGATPLLDAFCKAIDSTGSRLRGLMERERPDQVLFVVVTDGAENSSKEFKRRDVFDRVTTQREGYKWEFVYLGANQDTFAESQSFGIPWANTITYTPRDQYVGLVGQSVNSNTMSYVNRSSPHSYFSAEDRNLGATPEDRKQESVNENVNKLTSTTGGTS